MTMRMILKSIILILALTFPSAAFAGDLEDGLAAYYKQDYATALRLWQPLAEKGNASAQFKLGVLYDIGLGMVQDYTMALKWYTLAAEQGVAQAQGNLGLRYELGRGVIQDYIKAHMWYNISASNGDANAVKNRDNIAAEMTPAQIEAAKALAQQCIQSNYKQCE